MTNFGIARRAGFAVLALSLVSTGALAQSNRMADGNNPIVASFPIPTDSDWHFQQFTPAMRADVRLRDEALRLQRQDGGELTPEHVRYLQTKLDRLNAQRD